MNERLERLKPLVLEFQNLPDWPATWLSAGLLLYDFLVALGAPKTALENLLGRETLTLVENPATLDPKRISSP